MPKIIAKLHITLPDGRTQEAVLPGYPVIIGKATGNDIVINDSGVSRQHATVRLQNGEYVISDLGSLNGIYVNSRKVPQGDTHQLRDGDKIQLGRVKISFNLEEVSTDAVKSDAYKTQVDQRKSYSTNVNEPLPKAPAAPP